MKKNWEENYKQLGIEPWNATDQEDSGYRTCPSCEGKSESDGVNCDTCAGTGTVQWSRLYCNKCSTAIEHSIYFHTHSDDYDPDFAPLCPDCEKMELCKCGENAHPDYKTDDGNFCESCFNESYCVDCGEYLDEFGYCVGCDEAK